MFNSNAVTMLFNYKPENSNKTPVLLPLFDSIPAEKAGKSSIFIMINLGDLRCGNFSCNGTRISCLSIRRRLREYSLYIFLPYSRQVDFPSGFVDGMQLEAN